MKRFKSIALAAFFVLAAVVSVLPAQPVGAVDGSASLSIVPKKTYTVEPGKTISDNLTIRNLDAGAPLTLNLRVVDFTFSDDGGTPKLMLAEDAPQTTWSMRPFLTLPETVTIPPSGTKSINLSVGIPKSQGAGSYYSAIVYSTGAADGGNVGLSASGVTLIFTSIPGKVNESLNLKKFGAYNLTAQGNNIKAGYVSVSATKPWAIAYTLENKGNVTESPIGTITLKHMFGNEQVIADVNPNKSLALIGQTRTFTACIKLKTEALQVGEGTTQSTECTNPTLWPGRYTASLDVFYGQNGNNTEEIVKTTAFWYLPWWFVISFIVLLLIVALAVWRLVVVIRSKFFGGHSSRRKTSYRSTSRRR